MRRNADDVHVWIMNHPSAPLRDGKSVKKLGKEFRSRQKSQLVRLSVRSRGRQLRFALYGAVLGIAAVCALCVVEHQALNWYTPAWEALLGGLAGFLLARSGGGFLNGVVLFGLAYMATILLRETGYDSSEVLGRYVKARVVSLHGDFAALLALSVLGGLIGFTSDRR